MTPKARLIAGCVIAFAGGVLCVVALNSTWRVFVATSTQVPVPGGGTAQIGGERTEVAGSTVVPWLVPVAYATAVLPAVSLLAGRRARAAMLAVAMLLALLIMGGVMAAPSVAPMTAELVVGGKKHHVETTSWPGIMFLGAGLVLAGGAVAAKPAATVPKLGLPERPPSEVEP